MSRVQRALARRERLRRFRDRVWVVFAAAGSAALLGWSMTALQFSTGVRPRWWAMTVYVLIGIVFTYLAIRAFRAGMRVSRRMDTQALDLSDEREEPLGSIWDEIMRAGAKKRKDTKGRLT
ncbi:MAG TPA: hypothetical protein VF329_05925 [Gammaproteobacteria bacterium]